MDDVGLYVGRIIGVGVLALLVGLAVARGQFGTRRFWKGAGIAAGVGVAATLFNHAVVPRNTFEAKAEQVLQDISKQNALFRIVMAENPAARDYLKKIVIDVLRTSKDPRDAVEPALRVLQPYMAKIIYARMPKAADHLVIKWFRLQKKTLEIAWTRIPEACRQHIYEPTPASGLAFAKLQDQTTKRAQLRIFEQVAASSETGKRPNLTEKAWLAMVEPVWKKVFVRMGDAFYLHEGKAKPTRAQAARECNTFAVFLDEVLKLPEGKAALILKGLYMF